MSDCCYVVACLLVVGLLCIDACCWVYVVVGKCLSLWFIVRVW